MVLVNGDTEGRDRETEGEKAVVRQKQWLPASGGSGIVFFSVKIR